MPDGTKIAQAIDNNLIERQIKPWKLGAKNWLFVGSELAGQRAAMVMSLVLHSMGVDLLTLEVPLHILLVTFQAMKHSGHTWPLLSEDVQDRCLQRLTARARFNEGLPKDLAGQMVQQFCDEHRERYLLAFVYGYLGDHDLMQVRTEAEKYLMMAALTLVECIADVGARAPS